MDDLKPLRSIKGVGPKIVAPFLPEMGTVENFLSHNKLLAFAGQDPTVCPSGQFVGMSRISQRGNWHMRRAIYLMTSSVVSKNA
jgi:transposase